MNTQSLVFNVVPDPSFSSNQYPQQDSSQSRNDYNIPGYVQSGWPVNPTPTHQQSTSYQSDPRYQAAQAPFNSYPSRAQSAMLPESQDPRTLPPLNMAPGQTHPGSSNPSMMGGNLIRSPTAGYPAAYTPYSEHSQQPGNPYYPPPDPRNLPPPVPPMGYDSASGLLPRRSSMSVDRTVPSRLSVHGPSPYPRNPPMTSPSTYTPEPPAAEPAIKKKRKRADAEQLKVLNDTYNRTAFPSTEERAELAKRLNMSARSVQIWFQNKRQAMRQSSRQASTSMPPTTNEPFPSSSHLGALPPTSPYGAHPSGSASLAQPYGAIRPAEIPRRASSRMGPSPAPSAHHRGRSHEEEEKDRRFSGRQY